MASVVARSIATGTSALAGVAGGVITKELTDEWKWTWLVGLVVTTFVMVISQVFLVSFGSDHHVSAVGRGAVAAGGSVRGDIDIETGGSTGHSGAASSNGITAHGQSVIAAGRNIHGTIRIRSSRH
jgi:hypothetical protein